VTPRHRVMVVYGTRPEAVKLAPLVLALAGSPDLEPYVVVTAQHRTMLDQVNELFGIAPAVDLDIIEERQTLTDVTVRALAGLSPAVEKASPDVVVVQGDTTTTFAGALAAFYHRVPVVHLEAGLRTHDPYAPYPEEVNRRLTTGLAALHLAPTPASKANLLAEGVSSSAVAVTGNTVIDALLHVVDRQAGYGDPSLDGLDADPRRVLLVTAHRRESWGEPMRAIGRALARLADADPGLLVVVPLHRNPVVREALLPAVAGRANVLVTEPLPYGPFARLMARAHVILTDSGGVQEEGPSLGKPVLVMRDTTERPEAVAAGTARLVGTGEDALVGVVTSLFSDPAAYARMANAVNPYGDGRATPRCVAAIRALLGTGTREPDFVP
jgi:UDP-N-acetylglucosamine 2-epimerase (non-hydrolysing)